MYKVSKLDNQFTIATASMPHMCSASVGLWVGIGSRYEPAHLNGICHFIEHLVFKGTRKRSALEISQSIEGVGGYLNAFTSEDMTCIHARADAAHLRLMTDVLMDMLSEPALRASDLAKEREVIKEEIAMYLDEPQHQVQEELNATLWPNQPLGRSITGTPELLDTIGVSAVRNFLQNNYLCSNMILTAAGDVQHEEMVQLAAGMVKQFRSGTPPTFAPVFNAQNAPSVSALLKKTEQTQIALGIHTCSRFDPRRYAVRILNTILGENMSSRLFQSIREDRGLAYSIYSSPSFFADDGDLVLSAGMDTENCQKVLKLLLLELGKLRKTLVSKRELQQARDYVIGQMKLSLEGTETQMNWMGEQLLGYGRILSAEAVQKQLLAVRAQDVREAARSFFKPERLNLAVISPAKLGGTLLSLLVEAGG